MFSSDMWQMGKWLDASPQQPCTFHINFRCCIHIDHLKVEQSFFLILKISLSGGACEDTKSKIDHFSKNFQKIILFDFSFPQNTVSLETVDWSPRSFSLISLNSTSDLHLDVTRESTAPVATGVRYHPYVIMVSECNERIFQPIWVKWDNGVKRPHTNRRPSY